MKRFLAFTAMFPLLLLSAMFIVGLSLHRAVVYLFLRWKFGSRFAGILRGNDAIWVLDKKSNTGINNVLSFINEPLLERSGKVPQQIKEFLIQRFQKIRKQQHNPKVFLQRNFSLGYCFWMRRNEVNLDDYISFFEINQNASITEKELEDFMIELSGKSLLHHKNAWEVLIGTQYLKDTNGNVAKYPLVVRYHHSLGDGVSVIRSIMEDVTNQKQDSNVLANTANKVVARHKLTLWMKLKALYNAPYFAVKVLFAKETNTCWQMNTPSTDLILCRADENKILTNNCWKRLQENSRKISQKVTTHSVYMAVLSGSLYRYFASKDQFPTDINIFTATRVKQEDKQAKLKNSYGSIKEKLLILPDTKLDDPDRLQKLLAKLGSFKDSTQRLRSSSDFPLVHWIFSVIPSLCPLPILRLLLKPIHAPAIFSPLPEIKRCFKLGLHEVQDVYAFPPIYDTVGVNIVILPYGGQLRLTLVADRTVIPTIEEGKMLLNEFFREIERMDQVLAENQR